MLLKLPLLTKRIRKQISLKPKAKKAYGLIHVSGFLSFLRIILKYLYF